VQARCLHQEQSGKSQHVGVVFGNLSTHRILSGMTTMIGIFSKSCSKMAQKLYAELYCSCETRDYNNAALWWAHVTQREHELKLKAASN
jgi:hypothetical protein